jgi:hypothetical protein
MVKGGRRRVIGLEGKEITFHKAKPGDSYLIGMLRLNILKVMRGGMLQCVMGICVEGAHFPTQIMAI